MEESQNVMDLLFACGICSEDYNNMSVIPKVLNCGHTFCSPCISKLNSICLECQGPIDKEMEFPVNYFILKLIDECRSAKNLIPDIVCRVQDLKKIINSRLKTIQNEMTEKSTHIKEMTKDLEILKNLATTDLNDDSERTEVRKKLSQLEQSYEVTSLTNLEIVDDTNLAPDFSLVKSSSSETFLQEVYQSFKKNVKIFSFKLIKRKLKFGELTVRDNQIFIHSLSLDEIPNGSKTVSFEDLTEAFKLKMFHIFIEVTGRNCTSLMTLIKLQDNRMFPHFIKLCSGENGTSYKDCQYVRDYYPNNHRYRADQAYSILHVDISEGLPIDYYKNMPSNAQCSQDEVIVMERPNDGFALSKVHGTYNASIIGKVIYPPKLWDYVSDDNTSTRKILDCGIAIAL